MQEYPSVTKFMATNLVTFSPETDIRVAIDTLIRRKISGAPVLNADKQMIGMLSEVDCLKLIVEGPYMDEPNKIGTVANFMSTNVKTISPDKTILDAAYEFVHSGLKRLPVLENGRLVGQISRVDVLRAIQKIEPHIRHVPDSWKGRAPELPNHKKSRFNEHA
jgi:predicted transcriptional regulator